MDIQFSGLQFKLPSNTQFCSATFARRSWARTAVSKAMVPFDYIQGIANILSQKYQQKKQKVIYSEHVISFAEVGWYR